MEERTAQIDAYLSDSMTSEERKSFEQELETNSELKQELELQRKTFALLEAAAFLDTKEKVRALNQHKSGGSIGGTLLKVAAVLLVLMIPTYFILNNQFNNEHLFAEYSEPYPDRITTMGNSENELISEAMNLYKKKKYSEAAKRFEHIRLSVSDNENIVLYEAVSLAYSDQAEKAADLLELSLESKPSNFVSLEWQLILSYLASDQSEKAKNQLKKFLKHNEGYQQEKAEALLEDLGSVWR